MGPVAYAKDGKPVIFAVSSANAPQDVVMTVTAHGHTRAAHLLVIGQSTAGDTSTAGFSVAVQATKNAVDKVLKGARLHP